MRKSLQQPLPENLAHAQASRIAIGKHPVHVMLVVYPVALLTLVPGSDLLYLYQGSPFWALASFWMTFVGLALGILAAVVGLLDMFLIRVVRRHIAAWSHMLAAVMALAMAAVGVWLRWSDPEQAVWPWGLLASTGNALMTAIAGWLGGTLTFRHGIGVYGRSRIHHPADDRSPPDA